MVKIRLSRLGRHKRPFYRIVVAPSTVSQQGRQIEILGTYDPFTKHVAVNTARTSEWLKEGAIPTPTVKMLLKRMSGHEGKEGEAIKEIGI